MKIVDRIKTEINYIKNDDSLRKITKDVFLLFLATIAFHFLYWTTDMNHWIFGPWTSEIFNFFSSVAYKCSLPLCHAFIDKPFVEVQDSFFFYQTNKMGVRIYDSVMRVEADCSAIKQLLQFLLLMILCSGIWWRKIIYFVCGSIIILFFNVVRIFLLTWLFADNPDMFQSIHDWIARPLMYVVIFSLWGIWITYFAYKKKDSQTSKE
ncbi:MAG: exosortase/archaeosortase family protein [Bacteroidales bacterium]|jgi:exosortase/archaeosortase family protein|nr:exosortase/archaeosortase family protein [Bacteroidales bacterium]